MHECHVHVNLGMSAKNDNVSMRGLFMTTDQTIDVAIIGGGPAGLSCAYFLAVQGPRAMLPLFMQRAPT